MGKVQEHIILYCEKMSSSKTKIIVVGEGNKRRTKTLMQGNMTDRQTHSLQYMGCNIVLL
jgi:K+-sensing histidine kinase KdpD